MAITLAATTPPNMVVEPISLCAFRERSVDTAPVDRSDAGYAPLAELMATVGTSIGADGLLVAWHETACAPRFLFASGACEPGSAAEQAMLGAATAAVAVFDDAGQTRWAGPDAGSSAMLTTRIADDRGVMTITSLFGRIGDAAQARTRDAYLRLQPLVRAFFRLWTLRRADVTKARGLTAALDAGDVGTLLLNREGQVLFANAAAERLIACNDGIRRSGSLLGGSRLADTLRLQSAIEHVVNMEGDHAALPPTPVIALHRKGHRPLLAAIVACDRAAANVAGAAVIVHLFDSSQDVAPLLVPVCGLYGLSAVETKLACLLASGSALADAAKTMGVQEQTARSYLKQVFLKTDTNRQAELVWLLMKSAVRTTPGLRTRFV